MDVFNQQALQEAQEAQQQIAQLELALKSVMAPEARSRFANIKLASPDRAVQVMAVLAQLVQSGKISYIDDSTFKNLLVRMSSRKETSIVRK